jgi:hypothetical protein
MQYVKSFESAVGGDIRMFQFIINPGNNVERQLVRCDKKWFTYIKGIVRAELMGG